MARKNNPVSENVGIDKLESFLQSYFKQLIFGIAAVVVIFIAGYVFYSIHGSSKAKKADLVGRAELTLDTPAGIESFESLSSHVPFLKGYISVRASEAWAIAGDNDAALKELAGLSGNFKEIGDGLAFDLGANVNVEQFIKSGYMKPVWYYRLVLSSKPEDREKNLNLFKAAYPESRLLRLLENWSM